MPNVFIGMETSGQLRRRFVEQGHSVISCDLLRSDDFDAYEVRVENLVSSRVLAQPTGLHVVGDVFETLDRLHELGWWPDLGIFHPDCTYLTTSAAWAFEDGPYHQKVKPGTLVGFARRRERERALGVVRRIEQLPIGRKCYENPARGAINTAIRSPDQIVQPFEFGDDASKATGLWLRNLPKLRIDPNKRFDGRLVWQNGRFVERWSNQTDTGQNNLGQSSERWQIRSKTYDGIADAMAQWGKLLWEECLV